MAITITKVPESLIVSANNPIILRASSDNSTEDDFTLVAELEIDETPVARSRGIKKTINSETRYQVEISGYLRTYFYDSDLPGQVGLTSNNIEPDKAIAAWRVRFIEYYNDSEGITTTGDNGYTGTYYSVDAYLDYDSVNDMSQWIMAKNATGDFLTEKTSIDLARGHEWQLGYIIQDTGHNHYLNVISKDNNDNEIGTNQVAFLVDQRKGFLAINDDIRETNATSIDLQLYQSETVTDSYDVTSILTESDETLEVNSQLLVNGFPLPDADIPLTTYAIRFYDSPAYSNDFLSITLASGKTINDYIISTRVSATFDTNSISNSSTGKIEPAVKVTTSDNGSGFLQISIVTDAEILSTASQVYLINSSEVTDNGYHPVTSVTYTGGSTVIVTSDGYSDASTSQVYLLQERTVYTDTLYNLISETLTVNLFNNDYPQSVFLLWKNRLSGFDFWIFQAMDTRDVAAQREIVKNGYQYNVTSVTRRENWVITSRYVESDKMKELQGVIYSRAVYALDNNEFKPVIISNSSLNYKDGTRKVNLQLTITFDEQNA